MDFRGIKLLEIAPEYIRSLITERGIIPSSAFFHEAMEYARSLEGSESGMMRGKQFPVALAMIRPDRLPGSFRHDRKAV